MSHAVQLRRMTAGYVHAHDMHRMAHACSLRGLTVMLPNLVPIAEWATAPRGALSRQHCTPPIFAWRSVDQTVVGMTQISVHVLSCARTCKPGTMPSVPDQCDL